MLFLWGSFSFHRHLEPQLQALARQQSGLAVHRIVQEAIKELSYDSAALYHVRMSKEEEILQVEFDSAALNELLSSSLQSIDASLKAAQEGKQDPGSGEILYQDGVVYEVPLGYFTQLYVLADKGPRIKIRMRMLQDVTGEIKTSMEPYGINSSMVKITLVIQAEMQAITFLSVTSVRKEYEIPLVVQVISGKVPSYLPYTAKSEGS